MKLHSSKCVWCRVGMRVLAFLAAIGIIVLFALAVQWFVFLAPKAWDIVGDLFILGYLFVFIPGLIGFFLWAVFEQTEEECSAGGDE